MVYGSCWNITPPLTGLRQTTLVLFTARAARALVKRVLI